MDLGLSGLASGFDWRSLVSQLIQVERAPQQRMRQEQSTLQQRNSAYASIRTQLSALQSRLETLGDPSFFESRSSENSDPTVATAQAAAGTPLGAYAFTFTQLATAARQHGLNNVGKALSTTDNVSALTLSSAPFSSAIQSGTFTINGHQISLETTDTLQGVFDKIYVATGGAVTAAYSAATDRISLTSADEITLAAATDTSNFLQAAKLYNTGSGLITSTTSLGAVQLTAGLSSANLTTALTDGGAGAGQFKVNGVAIQFSATDSLQTVLNRITDSAAGVTASYDALHDRFILTNKSEGDFGIALEDVTGNFLAATGLSSGSLERGKNLLYTINNGDQLISQSNTITEESSGIAGLSLTALKQGSVTIGISSDTARIKTAIDDFLAEYNKAQSLIDTHTASSTDAKGKVTAGVLAGDPEANRIASRLRALAYSPIAGMADGIKGLADLGIVTSGDDNSLKLDKADKLNTALSTQLSTVKELFTRSTDGLADRLNDFLEKTAGDEGTLTGKQNSLTTESARIDLQIADFERRIAAEEERLVNSFIAMETAQAKINQQMQFLLQKFGTT